jgi:hypothetical protein
VDLRPYHGKRIGLLISVGGAERLICGTANYAQVPTVGNVLRIVPDAAAANAFTDILLSESEWRGKITADTEHGCDYLFRPG